MAEITVALIRSNWVMTASASTQRSINSVSVLHWRATTLNPAGFRMLSSILRSGKVQSVMTMVGGTVMKRSNSFLAFRDALRRDDFLLGCIPQHRSALTITFHGHLDGHHGGAAQFHIGMHRSVASHGVDPVIFEIPTRGQRQARLLEAVIPGLELLLEVTVPLQAGFTTQVHGAVLAVNAVGNSGIIGERADQKDRPFRRKIRG